MLFSECMTKSPRLTNRVKRLGFMISGTLEQDQQVWRIEWQVRKEILKRFSIRTFEDLKTGAGDILRYLASEHDSLRIPNQDSNRSRWPLHPLWIDLQKQIDSLSSEGVYRSIDPESALNERLMRIAISMYGNLKQVAAIDCVQRGTSDGLHR